MIIAEKILFNVIAFFLFVIIFFKMIHKNDTNYIVVLFSQAIGITINFIEILAGYYTNIILRIIMYVLAFVIPLFILLLEHRGHNFSENLSKVKAKIYLLLKNNKDAKDALIKLVTKYPDSYIGHKMLAEIYEKEGGMRKAIDEYVKAIDCQKKDYDSYYKVAYLLNDLGQKEESVTMLENLLQKKPDYCNASNLLGDILCEQEKFKEAINVYMDALRYHPEDYDLYYSLGIAYTRLNDFQNAKKCYEKAANINHNLYIAKYNLGQIALIYRDIEAAEQYFTECIYEESLEARAYFELSKIFMLKGEKEKAITFVNKSIELDISFKKKADEEPILIPIKAYIVMPKEETKEKQTLNKKAKNNIEHLEKTYYVVENLNLKELGKGTKLRQSKRENEKTL